ncbi:diguanylate cyclase [Christensenellaceae bacterium OttesenSCG-928-K19]|nr:diguanylate cyclase [Christensenellaceae bacterium OttesenSCG-928-K19]
MKQMNQLPKAIRDSSLTLTYHKKLTGEFRFTVTDITSGFQRFFFLKPNAAPEVVLPVIRASDPYILNEWIEYIVKVDSAPYLSNYDSVNNTVYEKSMMQFFQGRMAWKQVQLTVDTATSQVSIALQDIENNALKINKWSWQEISVSKQLGVAMGGGNYWDIDLQHKMVYLSGNLARRLEMGRGDMVVPLAAFFKRVHPDDRAGVENAIECMDQGHLMLRHRCLMPRGKTLHLTAYAIPFFDRNGDVSHIKGHVQDNTDQESAIEMLAISEKRFRNVVENANDIFVLLDRNGLINYVSPSVRHVLGYTEKKLYGKHYVHFLGPYTNPDKSVWDFHQNVLRKGQPYHEVQLLHTDGSKRWFRVSMSPIEDYKGQIVEIGVMCRDITREKQQKDKLLFLAHHDLLTHTLNRSYFEEMLEKISELEHLSCALIMLDLNGLRFVNDTFGRSKGDDLLAEAAHIFERAAAKKDGIVARTGGDEFVILVESDSPEEAESICRQIDEECTATKYRKIPLHVSWGIDFSAQAQRDIHKMYEKAEERMYRKKLLDSDSLHNHIISSLKTALESRHLETADHMSRMEKIVLSMGKATRLTSTELDRLVLLASLHDIGKVAIPDHIINKPGRLTNEEFEVMKTHSEVGRRIAISSQELACIADEIRHHHERWDGKGYPQGISGEKIPVLSRMVGVADAYDVMTNARPYKTPIPHKQALEELHRCSGTQFDPDIVNVFDKLYSNG